MSEKKILPKEAVSDERLGKVTGGTDDLGDTTVTCRSCGLEFSGYTEEFYNHMVFCKGQNLTPDPNKLDPEDPKPYGPV